MSDDILDQIDNALARNRRRFDPLGGDPWDEDQVERVGDGMRVRQPVDVTAGPSADADPATVDVRRRAQDGNDPVTAAMRDAVLRQGLTECEIDGVRQVYRSGEWHRVGPPCCDYPATNCQHGTFMTEEQFDRYVETGIEPDAPLVDASSDTAPDAPRTSKLSELAAALRARARRRPGGTT